MKLHFSPRFSQRGLLGKKEEIFVVAKITSVFCTKIIKSKKAKVLWTWYYELLKYLSIITSMTMGVYTWCSELRNLVTLILYTREQGN